MGYFELILGALVVILTSILWRALVSLTWRPYVITRMLREQGVNGPKYKFWSGNLVEMRRMDKAAKESEMDIYSHDIVPRVLSNYDKWISQYGGTFLYWYGARPKLCITEAEQIKQVLSNKFGFYVKMKPGASIFAIMGRGLALIEGSDWTRHRRVVSPAFTMDKLKMMTKSMADCTLSMLNSWEQMVQTDGLQTTVEVGRQFLELTADVISHSAFGTSYREGKEVFLAQNELQNIALSMGLNDDIPGYKYLPTSRNIKKWKLEKKMRNTLLSIIQSQLNSRQLGNHLLGLLIECNQKQEGVGCWKIRATNPQLSSNEFNQNTRRLNCRKLKYAGLEITGKVKLIKACWALSLRVDRAPPGEISLMHEGSRRPLFQDTMIFRSSQPCTGMLGCSELDQYFLHTDAGEKGRVRIDNFLCISLGSGRINI